MNNRQMFSTLASIQLELNKLMEDEFDNPEEELNWLSKTEKPSQSASAPDASPSDFKLKGNDAGLNRWEEAMIHEKWGGNTEKILDTKGNKATNDLIIKGDTSAIENDLSKIDETKLDKSKDLVLKFRTKFMGENSSSKEDLEKRMKDQMEQNKNIAFKYGLGLIVLGAAFGVIMFPSMKSQFSSIIENGKPVMEKVFSVLALIGTFTVAFVPLMLGSLLLWFSFSDEAPQKDGILDKIITASINFFQSVETALFGEAKPKAAAEAPKETSTETPKEAPKTEEPKVTSIQQRVAKLQLDLAKIAHNIA